ELLGLCTELTSSGAYTASDCQPTIRYLERITGALNHRMRREQGEGACLHMNPPSERVCDVYMKRTRKTVDSASGLTPVRLAEFGLQIVAQFFGRNDTARQRRGLISHDLRQELIGVSTMAAGCLCEAAVGHLSRHAGGAPFSLPSR